MIKQFYFSQFNLFAPCLNVKQFYLALSCVTATDQSGPRSDGNEGVLCILRSSSISGTSPLDCLMSYLEHSFVVRGLTPLQRCSRCILQHQPTGQISICVKCGSSRSDKVFLLINATKM